MVIHYGILCTVITNNITSRYSSLHLQCTHSAHSRSARRIREARGALSRYIGYTLAALATRRKIARPRAHFGEFSNATDATESTKDRNAADSSLTRRNTRSTKWNREQTRAILERPFIIFLDPDWPIRCRIFRNSHVS